MPEGEEIKPSGIPGFSFISVGTEVENVGITEFNMSKYSRFSPAELFVRVENLGKIPVQTFLEIYQEDNLFEAREVKLGGSEGKNYIFKIASDYSGKIRARITVNDALACDNHAYGIIRASEPMKVLLVSSEETFIDKSLSLIKDAVVEKIPPSQASAEKIENKDLVVWYKGSLPKGFKGNHLIIDSSFQGKELTFSGETENPLIISRDKTSPFLRFIDFSDISVLKAR